MIHLITALLLIAPLSSAFAGEYDDILRRQYRERQAAAGASTVAGYVADSARVRDFLRRYIANRGGHPDEASCVTTSGWSCDPLPCTPSGKSSVNINELGTSDHSFQTCDFSLGGNRACKVAGGYNIQCIYNGNRKDLERCREARLAVSCVDRATGATSGEYIRSY